MSAAASDLELSSEGQSLDLKKVPDLERTLDVLASSGPVIACDLDDVLCQTNAAVAQWHNEEYGTNMTLDDFYYFYYWKNPYWGSLQETYKKVRNFYATTQLYDAIPVPGAREGVQALHDMGFKLIIVTARSQEVKEETCKWVDRWFPGLFDSVIYTGQFKMTEDGQKNTSVTIKLSKAQVCADLKAQVLIDDSSENALQLVTDLSEPIPVLLFGQYEWNQRISLPSDSAEAMVFENRLQIEGGREFWKEEKFEDHIPEGSPIHRVKDWSEVVSWITAAQAKKRL
ncbi:hypothetical protein GYMLUDRAFT_33525 [Collybiopsis luxurians FD-317 M1]|nr:hypothetical protein GYMLUDRAFT_33525 [Collybiopsis luxurians FD-317 M1]